MRGGRNSRGGRSDIAAIDAGRVRAPSWGRRGPGSWHTQGVVPEFFTRPVTEANEWPVAIETAVDHALETLRG